MIKTYIFDKGYIQVVKVPFCLHIRKKKFTVLKIRHLTIHSSLRHKQCDVIGDLCIPKTFQNMTSTIYETILFCLNFHKHIFYNWTRLVQPIESFSTQRQPHVRPRAMRRAAFSFTNNNPFYHKQSILLSEQSILLSEQSILLENNTILLLEQSILLENNTILPILQLYND